jgi:flavin reductase (DIM6/NTAB) family NADH-FMN oxidoreductase RutF
MVTEAMTEKMNVASGDYAAHVSEFDEAGLTPVASEAIRAPRIAESPVNFECRLIRAVTVADNTVFFGEAVRLHVDEGMLTNGAVDVHKAKPIGRLGGPRYCRTQDVFELRRPSVTGPKAAGKTEAR